jgi:hypothetical protein
MHALVRFANIAAGSAFTTADLYPHVLDALRLPPSQYSLASLRYDLSKLRAQRPGGKTPALPSLPIGQQRLFPLRALPEAIRAYLCSAHCWSSPALSRRSPSPQDKRCQLDRLYQRVTDDLDALFSAVGLKIAASSIQPQQLLDSLPESCVSAPLVPRLRQFLPLDRHLSQLKSCPTSPCEFVVPSFLCSGPKALDR